MRNATRTPNLMPGVSNDEGDCRPYREKAESEMNPADNRYGVAVLLETGTGIPNGGVMQYNVDREFVASEWTKVPVHGIFIY